MEFIVPGICAVLVILGLVAIVMSRGNWRIPQMILVFFILVFSLAFFYLSARTLKTHENWEKELIDFRAKIEQTQKEIDGEPDKKVAGAEAAEAQPNDGLKGIRDRSKLAVAAAMAERGRVWFDAKYERVNAATGEISASFDQQPPFGLEPKAVVFVFEDKEKGLYLGEFVVKSVVPKVTLAPVAALLQEEIAAIGKSRGPWVFYEVMPVDSHTVFADLAPAALKAMLPAASEEALAEFTRDGKPAKYDPEKDSTHQPAESDPADHVQVLVRFSKDWAPPDDPAAAKPAAAPAAPAAPANPADKVTFKAGDVAYLDPDTALSLVKPQDMAQKVAEFEKNDPEKPFLVYVRPLNDYARLFREIYRRRNELFALEAELTVQRDQLKVAVDQVTEDVKAATDERTTLQKDLTKFQSELEAVVAYKNALAAKQTEVNAKCSELFRANLRLNAQLAEVESKLIDAAARQAPAEASASLGR